MTLRVPRKTALEALELNNGHVKISICRQDDFEFFAAVLQSYPDITQQIKELTFVIKKDSSDVWKKLVHSLKRS